jgi:LTXXQ motif family protein
VRRMLLAAALAATTAIVVPVFAQQGGNTETQTNQVAPATQQVGGNQDADSQWTRGRGGWGMRGWPMMRRGMWRNATMRADPQQRCIDRLAWHAAQRAYLETELDLTAAQRPLWDKLQSIAQAEQQKERQWCQQRKPGEQSTALDRMDRAQQFLSARLDAVQSAKPALQALYQALTPEQRAIMDHPFRRP